MSQCLVQENISHRRATLCSHASDRNTPDRLRGARQHVLETLKLKRAPSPRHVSVTAGNQWLKEKDGGPTRVFSHRPRFFISFLSFLFNFHVAGNRRSEQERKTRLTEPSTAEQISRRHGDDRGVTWTSAASLSAALHSGSIGYAHAFWWAKHPDEESNKDHFVCSTRTRWTKMANTFSHPHTVWK